MQRQPQFPNSILFALALVVGCQSDKSDMSIRSENFAFTTAGVKLIPTNPLKADWYGSSIAVSNGNIIVGAPGSDRAYIFTGTGTIWKQQAYVVPSSSTIVGSFGSTVAIEGNTAVVGNDWDISYLYQRNTNIWAEKQKLSEKGGPFKDRFGSSIDIDEDTIIIGAPNEDGQAENSGAAYVFLRSGTSWNQQATLRGSSSISNHKFGRAVAIDKDTAVIGSGLGYPVYFFIRTGTSWKQQKVLSEKQHGGTYNWGCSIDISLMTVAIGDPGLNSDRGSVFIFLRSGTIWNLQQKLTATGATDSDSLGADISLDHNVLVSAIYRRNALLGGVVFIRQGTAWTETQQLSIDERGYFRYVSVDGDTVALANEGSAYVYTVVKPDGGPELGPDVSPPDHSAKDIAAEADLGDALPVEGCSCTMNSAQLTSPLMPVLGLTILSLLGLARKRRPVKP